MIRLDMRSSKMVSGSVKSFWLRTYYIRGILYLNNLFLVSSVHTEDKELQTAMETKQNQLSERLLTGGAEKCLKKTSGGAVVRPYTNSSGETKTNREAKTRSGIANTVAKIFLQLLRATRQTRKHSSTLLLKKKKTSKRHAKKGFA